GPGRLVRPVRLAVPGAERRPGAGRGAGTLLGPEGTAVGLSSARTVPPGARLGGGGRGRPVLENCTVDASIICSCQVNKGTRWMPWYQEPRKDVGACDKPWESATRRRSGDVRMGKPERA